MNTLPILSTVLLILASTSVFRVASGNPLPPTGECREPADSAIRDQWMNYTKGNAMHESLWSTVAWESTIEPLLNEDLTSSSPTVIYLFGSKDCNPDPSDPSLQRRSLCPWYNVITRDPARYPRYLVEARCSCSRCYQISGDCNPVNFNVRVLKRTDICTADGTYLYKESWHRIPVGCTCVVPETD